jgi:SOS-response transcriptional repressor LexA
LPEKRVGRPPGGKRSSDQYVSSRVYIRGDLKDEAEQRKTDAKKARVKGPDISDLVNTGLELALSQEWVRLPIIGRVGAGASVICEEHVEDYVTLPVAAAKGADFVLRARGDSMAPTIADGDEVLVHIQPTAEIGQIVVVRQDGEAVIKRLKGSNGDVELCSDNPAYPPFTLPRGEIVGRAIRVVKDL